MRKNAMSATDKIYKFLWQALALSLLALSTTVLAQESVRLVPMPTPLGEPQRYILAELQQSDVEQQQAEYILKALPARLGELQQYNLIKVSGNTEPEPAGQEFGLSLDKPLVVTVVDSAPNVATSVTSQPISGSMAHDGFGLSLDQPLVVTVVDSAPNVATSVTSQPISGSMAHDGFGLSPDQPLVVTVIDSAPNVATSVTNRPISGSMVHDGFGLSLDQPLVFTVIDSVPSVATSVVNQPINGSTAYDGFGLSPDQPLVFTVIDSVPSVATFVTNQPINGSTAYDGFGLSPDQPLVFTVIDSAPNVATSTVNQPVNESIVLEGLGLSPDQPLVFSVKNSESSIVASVTTRPTDEAILDVATLARPLASPHRNTSRGTTAFFLGISNSQLDVNVNTGAYGGGSYSYYGDSIGDTRDSGYSYVEDVNIRMLQMGLRHDGAILGIDWSLGIGSVEFGSTRGSDTGTGVASGVISGSPGVATQSSYFDRRDTSFDLLATELHFRFLPKSVVQPFLMFGRQVAGVDLTDDALEHTYNNYSGFGLRFKLSPNVSMSLSQYEYAIDDTNSLTDYSDQVRAQLDFAF